MKKQTTGVYLLKDNKMLFLIRNKKNDKMHQQGMYLPIGGHVELGEGLEEAAIREVKEESGIKVQTVDLRGIIYLRSQNRGEYDNIIFIFTSKDFSGMPVSGREGKFEWVSIDEFKKINIYEGDKIFLNLLIKHDFFVVDFLYKGFELISHKVLKLVR
jgi:8-oxo-dGTP diphosphatase